jgi:hypothetical protein
VHDESVGGRVAKKGRADDQSFDAGVVTDCVGYEAHTFDIEQSCLFAFLAQVESAYALDCGVVSA